MIDEVEVDLPGLSDSGVWIASRFGWHSESEWFGSDWRFVVGGDVFGGPSSFSFAVAVDVFLDVFFWKNGWILLISLKYNDKNNDE